jgi:hypothetical protein
VMILPRTQTLRFGANHESEMQLGSNAPLAGHFCIYSTGANCLSNDPLTELESCKDLGSHLSSM